MNIQKMLENALNWERVSGYVTSIGSKLLFAVILLMVGLFLIKYAIKLTKKVLNKAYHDKTLVSFLSSALSIALKMLLIISVLSMLGIEMTSFIALFGAAGLAIGLAFQGSLSNFASGILILAFRPFNVGDHVKSQDFSGVVKEIQVLYTILLTDDNKKVIMPNSGIYSNIISVRTTK